MANKAKTSTSGMEEDEISGIKTPVEREDEDTEAAILAEFNKGDDAATWKVSVCRAAKGGEPEPYLFSCSPSELPVIDRLRDEYGTGSYRIRVYRNNLIFRSFTVGVEARRAPTTPAPAVVPASDGLAAALERQTALLERLINQRQQPVQQVDSFGMMTTLLGAIGQIKGLFGAPATSSAENAIELFMKGIEAAKDLGGSDKGNTGLMDIVRDLLKSPIIEKMIEGAAANVSVPHTQRMVTTGPGIGETPQPLSAQPPPQPTTPPTPSNGDTINQQVQPPGDDPRLVAMTHNIRYLATKAAANADVELYADWVLDNVPADLLTQLVNDPTALTMLSTAVPEARPYVAWFGQLLELVKEALTPDGSEVQDVGHVQPRPAVNADGTS